MALERPSNAAFRLACPLAPNAASATLPAPSLPASSNVQQNASNPIEDALCGHHGGPQSLCETAVLLPRPGAEFVRRQERDRPVLQVSPGPFSPGGNRIASGGEFQQLLSGI